jgi:hypothetical protein
MVTGAPGSRKTTLGLQLSAALRVPFFSRDHIRGGLLATAGLWMGRLHDPPPREAAIDAFVDVVETAARRGVTSVIELVVTPARVEALHRLQRSASVLLIVAAAADAVARAEGRDRADPLLNRHDVLDALGYGSIDDYLDDPERDVIRTAMQTDFDLPLLRVSTDRGYDPTLETIVDWVVAQTRGETS